MSLRISPRLTVFSEVEFTRNVYSESGSSTGRYASFCSDKEINEIISARSSFRLALVNFLGGKMEVYGFTPIFTIFIYPFI